MLKMMLFNDQYTRYNIPLKLSILASETNKMTKLMTNKIFFIDKKRNIIGFHKRFNIPSNYGWKKETFISAQISHLKALFG